MRVAFEDLYGQWIRLDCDYSAVWTDNISRPERIRPYVAADVDEHRPWL